MIRPTVQPLDLDADPQTVYARLADRGSAVLLESTKLMPGLSGWSYVSGPALAKLETRGATTTLRPLADTDCIAQESWADPFEALRTLIDRLQRADKTRGFEATLPAGLSFRGGLIGFLGYDLVRHVERLPVRARAESTVPDLLLYLADHVLAFDHAARRWYFCGTPWPGAESAERGRVWERTLISTRGTRSSKAPHAFNASGSQASQTFDAQGAVQTAGAAFEAGPLESGTPAATYLEHVNRCRDYIAAGDIFQVNLSHRLDGAFRGDPFGLYRRLTEFNPAPFAAFIPGDAFTIAGASPERFLRLDQGIVTARPIKGTRARGASTDEDHALRDELAASDKDRAENLMIVDLMRNDLGRVARTGSVHVEKLFEIEAHPSVWQMVSTIRARLRDGANAADLLRACWPPGSMTGAPKVRAMQIIEEFESVRRGPYAGAIGYFAAGGAMDLSVVIRTAVVTGERIALQVGGAIVADSDPTAELAETYAKGSLLLRALEKPPLRT